VPDTLGPYKSHHNHMLPGQGRAHPRQPPWWAHAANFDDWAEGDIVLLAANPNGGTGSQIIRWYQRHIAGLPVHRADWTHVGVYLGDAELIEATPKRGVCRTELFNYLDVRNVCVRRMVDQTGSTARGPQIAEHARKIFANRPGYAWGTIWKIATRASRKPIAGPEVTAAYCAGLCEEVVKQALQMSILDDTSVHPLPAHFYEAFCALSIEVGWMRL
jgi:hypothetical protein